jgi:NAD(P)-dependent dehydrogenase (short-subunit alcohol dehydrogenase family)
MNYLSKLRLDGRRALVTGGAAGISAACVDALLEAGAEVVIVDLNASNLNDARQRLMDAAVIFEHADITDFEKVNELAEKLGTIDVLVNNAGIGRQKAGEDISPRSGTRS